MLRCFTLRGVSLWLQTPKVQSQDICFWRFSYWCRPGVSNSWPAGQIWSANWFHASRHLILSFIIRFFRMLHKVDWFDWTTSAFTAGIGNGFCVSNSHISYNSTSSHCTLFKRENHWSNCLISLLNTYLYFYCVTVKKKADRLGGRGELLKISVFTRVLKWQLNSKCTHAIF